MNTYHLNLDLFINVSDEDILKDLDAVRSRIIDSVVIELQKKLLNLFKEEYNEKKDN